MFKKTIYLFFLFLFIASCETMSSVKRGLSGEKVNSTDEFLVEKKDPLILPPDYEELPIPGQAKDEEIEDEIIVFKKSMSKSEKISSTPNSTEQLILDKIKAK